MAECEVVESGEACFNSGRLIGNAPWERIRNGARHSRSIDSAAQEADWSLSASDLAHLRTLAIKSAYPFACFPVD